MLIGGGAGARVGGDGVVGKSGRCRRMCVGTALVVAYANGSNTQRGFVSLVKAVFRIRGHTHKKKKHHQRSFC